MDAKHTNIRRMIRRDMMDVLAIEQACFGMDAWTEEQFIRELRNRNTIGMSTSK